MRYGTWKIDFSQNTNEGTTPLNLEGVFHESSTTVVGYMPATEDIALLTQWDVVEITDAEFLTLALAVNPSATMVGGLLVTPLPL